MSQHDRTHHAKIATGKGDPQCFKGTAGGPPKFKVGDRVRIKDLPDIFYTRCQVYTHESPAPEDEAWGHVDHSEWFYIIRFKQKDLWPEYPDTFGNDSLQTEFSERWLEPA